MGFLEPDARCRAVDGAALKGRTCGGRGAATALTRRSKRRSPRSTRYRQGAIMPGWRSAASRRQRGVPEPLRTPPRGAAHFWNRYLASAFRVAPGARCQRKELLRSVSNSSTAIPSLPTHTALAGEMPSPFSPEGPSCRARGATTVKGAVMSSASAPVEIGHVALIVRDIDRICAVYESAIGPRQIAARVGTATNRGFSTPPSSCRRAPTSRHGCFMPRRCDCRFRAPQAAL